MTSRRTFIGLIAAAPFVAPTAVKGGASPRYLSGISGEAFLVGEKCSDFPLTPNQFRAFHDMIPLASEPNEALRRLMHSRSPWDAPNRLHGAYINDDGDAV